MAEQDPDELVKKAQKKLDPGFFKSIFTDGGERVEKAIKYYKEAAEIYKINREWVKAGDCFIEIANLKEGLKEDQTESFKEAILCYDKGGAKDKYEKLTNKIVNIYVKNGEFINAGELTFEKANTLLENSDLKGDKAKLKEILEIYDQALDFYQMDKNSNENRTNKIKEAKADLISLNGITEELAWAKSIYEDLGKHYQKSKAGKIFSTDYFAKVVFLYLAYEDCVTAKAFLNRYYGEDKALNGSDIAYFLENLIRCMENNGEDIKDEDLETEEKVMNFDVACQLYKAKINFNKKIWDNWKITIVGIIGKKIEKLRKEKQIEEDEDDFK